MLMQPIFMQLIPTHDECHLLCVVPVCPYEGQSSCLILSTTKTSYIWVTKNPPLHIEQASPCEGQTSHPSFS